MPLPQGRLSTQHLPAEQGRQVWRQAVVLHCRIEDAAGEPVDLWITDNRRSVVSVRRNGERCTLRLHHMFVEADEVIVGAIAVLCRGARAGRSRARNTLQQFTRENVDKIRRFDPPKRGVRVRTRGVHHDLRELYDNMVATYLDGDPEVAISWGRFSGRSGKKRRSVRLGSYDARRRLIRIHPMMDRADVPAWVVAFVLYHEVLHCLYPPITSRHGRNQLHHEEFRRQEAKHPDYERFEAWARDVLPGLM